MKKNRSALLIITAVFIASLILAGLFYHGILLFNNPSAYEYPVRGVDVSAYQGDIDWENLTGALPPVVDFEFYGDKEKNKPEKEAARAELDIILNELEIYYGVKPLIYATEAAYDAYLAGYYGSYDIWIRNVFSRPKKLQAQTWKFWQYTNRARLSGYSGPERYIDMNVFNGTIEEFYSYAK